MLHFQRSNERRTSHTAYQTPAKNCPAPPENHMGGTARFFSPRREPSRKSNPPRQVGKKTYQSS